MSRPRKQTPQSNFKKSLKEIQQNRAKSNNTSPCCDVVGDMGAVFMLAGVWEQCGHLLQLITSNDMVEFASMGEFTAEEYKKYLRGTTAIPAFLMQCYAEKVNFESKKKEKEENLFDTEPENNS